VSYFAVLSRGLPSRPTVKECHLNFWVIPTGIFQLFREKHLFDVGLILEFENNADRIRVSLPFDADENVIDLKSKILDSELASLIFGKPVQVNGATISYAEVGTGQPLSLNVLQIDARNTREDESSKKVKNFSTWEIRFDGQAQPGQKYYLRFRFKPKRAEPYWFSKGFGFRKRGRITDIRVSDVRESIALGLGVAEKDHLVDLERVFVFVACDVNFTPLHASPMVHYTRVLEPKVWSAYLEDGFAPSGVSRLAIHQWRNQTLGAFKTVTEDRPFRVFADLTKDYGLQILATAIGVSIILVVLKALWPVVSLLLPF
jgi:hypothetical protein